MVLIPDEGIQKVTVSKTELPKITKDGKYYVRYRIVSDDGNKTSSWSPKYAIQKDPVSSTDPTDYTILNPEGTTPAKYEVVSLAKSHGKTFDVSWKINNVETDLIEIPKPIEGISYDSYVRWGGKITAISSVGSTRTISLNFEHKTSVGEIIVIEDDLVEDDKTSYTVTNITFAPADTQKLDIVAATFPYAVGDYLWTPWELVTTTQGNSFSVPIPASHESTATIQRYAEFMVHISTTTKDVDEFNNQTLLFYTSATSTKAIYDSTSIV